MAAQSKQEQLRLAQGKHNVRATSPKGKLEFKFFFSSPENHILWCAAYIREYHFWIPSLSSGKNVT